MIDNSIISVVIIHLFAAILQLAFWRKTKTQSIISVVASVLGVLFSAILFYRVYSGGILTMNAADWRAPYGIVFVADMLSSSMVLIASIAGLAVSVFSIVGISRSRMLFGYFPMFHILVMGLMGAFLTGDVFNLYVWFEIVIISSFVLMTLGGRKTQLEGAVKYMALNILASTFFLTGIGILYSITGTLNMADLAIKIPEVTNTSLVNITAIFFLLGFGTKAAVFPLYFWLPSSYHTPPSAVAAIFGGLLTKVGVYALFRSFTLLFPMNHEIQMLLIFISIFTIITGLTSALIKKSIRRLFSALIVCHIGFMIGGLGVFNKLAMTGAILYLFHDILVKTNMFLIAGLIRQMRGSMNMKAIGGLYPQYPKLSLVMALVLFSVVGIPPLSGFWPKIYLINGAYAGEAYLYIAALIAGSFVTLFVIARLWSEVFWKDNPDGSDFVKDTFYDLPIEKKLLMTFPIILLATCTLYVGLNVQAVIEVVNKITYEMFNTSVYIKAVLG